MCQVIGCGKRYTDPSSLRKHVKNHTEIATSISKTSMDVTAKSTQRTSLESVSDSYTRRRNQSASPPAIDFKLHRNCDFMKEENGTSPFDESRTVERLSSKLKQDQPEYVPYDTVHQFRSDDDDTYFATGGVGKNQIQL